MVTKPNTPMPPSGQEPLKTLPKIEPAKIASGVSTQTALPQGADPANRDKTGENKFTLPEKVTQAEIRDGSFKYGGGRSAGNRSMADNLKNKAQEP
jgi:hypothetical protein